MPRKDFHNHLKDAQNSTLPDNVSALKPGTDDGSFTITYQNENIQEIRIQIQASDVSDYPRSHTFFVYTDSNDVSLAASTALQDVSLLSEMTISQTVNEIASKLNYATALPRSDDDGDILMEEEDISDPDDFDDGFCPIDDDDIHYSDYDMGSPTHKDNTILQGTSTKAGHFSQDERDRLSAMLLADVKVARQAGFRVSHYGDIFSPSEQCYLMVSVRVAKLGVQDDTRRAWHLNQEDYIMLVLKYSHGYKGLQTLKNSTNGQNHLTMNLLVTKKHKLSFIELTGFLDSTKNANNENEIAEKANDTDLQSRPLFIGPALNELLNTRLLTIISYRLTGGWNWTSAMQYYNDQQGALGGHATKMVDHQQVEDTTRIKHAPELVMADHVGEALSKGEKTVSLPCAAMQFALRHIVRCTEFCLVCFADTEDEFEALKPYVCSRPLCLYQYMSMGLGPGIEFEVLSQPYVVDLLVSFCYAAARDDGLRELPTGLSLLVPDPNLLPGYPQTMSYPSLSAQNSPLAPLLSDATNFSSTSNVANRPGTLGTTRPPSRPVHVLGKWDKAHQELILPEAYNIEHDVSLPSKMFKVGDWLAFWGTDDKIAHCKITEAYHPKYRYQNLIRSRATETILQKDILSKQRVKNSSAANIVVDVKIVPYGRFLDDLGLETKRVALRVLLDTLPPISEMVEYLRNEKGSRSQLSKNTEQIIPAALAILRWIVASNRSCLVYTSDDAQEERIYGMPGYIQFRFASGAPDKESRFLKNVGEVRVRRQTECPTIFAWHGSPLKNWHSIIRAGLDFKNVVNGRAYGNGVYHAMQANTSMTYAHAGTLGWPASMLNIQQVLSLNEVVNAPTEFQSSSPYLVVQHIDWIQTRYLFVKCGKTDLPTTEEEPQSVIPQDPAYRPLGIGQQRLVIPTCAVSKSRRLALALEKDLKLGLKRKSVVNNAKNPVYISDDSEAEDNILHVNQPATHAAMKLKPSESGQKAKKPENLTDFEPGSLDRSNLPLLAPPTYASPSSSKALQRELKSMLKEQQELPIHELGWYLDPEHIDNPYQWIVELHSFDKNLPLAKDMKTRKIRSIVLEMRFGPSFNFSPPFVRIIRPRFLPFMQGGGGHVTAGGALCMQLLTSDGWNPSATMSAVLLQVRMAITSLDPTPARLDHGNSLSEYGIWEAIDAYKRACIAHGWKIPDDFNSMTMMTAAVATEAETSSNQTLGVHKKQKRT